jgi:hypothetical protein
MDHRHSAYTRKASAPPVVGGQAAQQVDRERPHLPGMVPIAAASTVETQPPRTCQEGLRPAAYLRVLEAHESVDLEAKLVRDFRSPENALDECANSVA